MVSDTGYLVARLKCFLKSIVSRGILQCFRLILALTRRLLGFHDPKHTNPGYTATYGSSCAIQQQPTLSVPYVPPVDSVHCTSATNLSGLAPGSALSVAQYPPSTAPLTPQTSQADLGRSASPAKALVQPFAPEEVQRYKRNIRINKKVIIPPIRPLQVDYNRPRIHDWQRCTHPEGAVYFRWDHDGKTQTWMTSTSGSSPRIIRLDYGPKLKNEASTDNAKCSFWPLHSRRWGLADTILSLMTTKLFFGCKSSYQTAYSTVSKVSRLLIISNMRWKVNTGPSCHVSHGLLER
ncbi:hypothetical protein F5I97DRAFT_646093 [Phlebopus sp. FC_14]|nr:hypothetical protein F5I97DRAFT_646093 [Phlebopus sp. FC_14]